MNEFDVIEQLFLNMLGVFSVPFQGAPLIMWFVGVAILMNFMRYLKIFITGTTIDEQSLRDFYNYMENLDRPSKEVQMSVDNTMKNVNRYKVDGTTGYTQDVRVDGTTGYIQDNNIDGTFGYIQDNNVTGITEYIQDNNVTGTIEYIQDNNVTGTTEYIQDNNVTGTTDYIQKKEKKEK